MKKILTLIMIACIANIYAIDKKAGEYGFQFMKLPSVTSVAGMGGTGEMLQSSPLNFLHHPAAFDWQRGKSVAFTNTLWLVETNIYSLAYRTISFNNGFGFGIKYMDMGKFEKRTDNGTLIGSYYPLDVDFVFNYVHKLSPDIHAGANIHLVYEKIDTSSATGFYLDLGTAYLTPLANTTLDLAVKNIGFGSKMDQENVDATLSCEFGLTTGIILSEEFEIYPATKLIYYNDHDDIIPAIGIDLKILNILSIRTGYKFNYNCEDFSAGFGVTYKNFTIDYSYLNFTENLDKVNIFGIGYKF